MHTLSCGHKVSDFDESITAIIKSESLDMQLGYVPAVAYMTICKSCYQEYESDNLILETEEAEMNYLFSK